MTVVMALTGLVCGTVLMVRGYGAMALVVMGLALYETCHGRR